MPEPAADAALSASTTAGEYLSHPASRIYIFFFLLSILLLVSLKNPTLEQILLFLVLGRFPISPAFLGVTAPTLSVDVRTITGASLCIARPYRHRRNTCKPQERKGKKNKKGQKREKREKGREKYGFAGKIRVLLLFVALPPVIAHHAAMNPARLGTIEAIEPCRHDLIVVWYFVTPPTAICC